LTDHRDQKTDDHDRLEDDQMTDDLPNHHDHTTDDLKKDDQMTNGQTNHHDCTTDDHHDQQADDHDLGHRFDHRQDDLLDDFPDGPDGRHEIHHHDWHPDQNLGDHDQRQDVPNDHLRYLDAMDEQDDLSLPPVADDVDRDLLELAPGKSTCKQR
jgi:hypothetical protein